MEMLSVDTLHVSILLLFALFDNFVQHFGWLLAVLLAVFKCAL